LPFHVKSPISLVQISEILRSHLINIWFSIRSEEIIARPFPSFKLNEFDNPTDILMEGLVEGFLIARVKALK
jgi:hypothetical protein